MSTKKKELIWRLSSKVTVEEVLKLLDHKIINSEEARELIFRIEEEKKLTPDAEKDLKDELKLLRDLVLELCKKNIAIAPYVIREVEIYPRQRWAEPYYVWCSSVSPSINLNGNGFYSGSVSYSNLDNNSQV